MKTKISDLREHLFEMLETIKDKDTKVDLERYRLGVDVANSIINSAKVEVEHLKTVGGKSKTGFFPEEARLINPPPHSALGKDSH